MMFNIIIIICCIMKKKSENIVLFRCGPVASVSLLYIFSVYRSGPGMVLHILS